MSKYPYLFAELIRRGYSDDDIKKVAGLNLIRVFEGVEKVRVSAWYCVLLVTCVRLFGLARSNLFE